MDVTDLLALPLLLGASLGGSALALLRSGRPLRGLDAATEVCLRLAGGGILIVLALVAGRAATGAVALVPVLLLALDLCWDLGIPDADPQGD